MKTISPKELGNSASQDSSREHDLLTGVFANILLQLLLKSSAIWLASYKS